MLIVIPHVLSLFYSYDLKSSLMYLFWVLFNFLFIITPIINYIDYDEKTVWKYYIYSFRIVGLLTIIHALLLLMGIEIPMFLNNITLGIPRPSAWFYEVSYSATYMLLYFGISIFLYENLSKKEYRFDLFFSIFIIALTTSTTGYIGIFLGFLIGLFLIQSKDIFYKLKIFFNIVFIIGIILLIFYLFNPNIIKFFIGRIFTSGIAAASGERVSGWKYAFELFIEHPFLGIGAGAYETYYGFTATNVTLEILSTLGLFGFSMFVLFFIYLFFAINKKNQTKILKSLLFSLFLFLVMLQANQNYMRMYMWLHIALILGFIETSRKGQEKYEKNNSSISQLQ